MKKTKQKNKKTLYIPKTFSTVIFLAVQEGRGKQSKFWHLICILFTEKKREEFGQN